MDFKEIMDKVFYKTDKNTGERKVSCCKLIIVVFIIFMIIGILTGGGSNESHSNTSTNDTLDNNKSNSTNDTLELLDIEPFTKDTEVEVWGKYFLIPKGYGEDMHGRSVHTDTEDGLISHHGLYMYYNGHSYISIGYISFENSAIDEGMLSDGLWETIGGYEGKLAHDDDGYTFEFVENGNSYTVYADSKADIEKVLI
jgi:hypothetical protein